MERWDIFQTGKPLSEEEDKDSHVEGPYNTTANMYNDFLSLSPERPTEFIPVITNLGKRKAYKFWRSLNTGSELTLVSGDLKDHHGPSLEWNYMGNSQ